MIEFIIKYLIKLIYFNMNYFDSKWSIKRERAIDDLRIKVIYI